MIDRFRMLGRMLRSSRALLAGVVCACLAATAYGQDLQGADLRPSLPSHTCPFNYEVQAVGENGAAFREMQRGAELGCAKCRSNLSWWYKHNRPQPEILAPPAASRENGLPEYSSDESPSTPHSQPAPENRVHECPAADDASALRQGRDAGCRKCAERLSRLQSTVPAHRCHSNSEVQAVIEGSATHREMQHGASLGCPRCKENLRWWESRQSARSQSQPAAHAHSCPSNAQVRGAVRGGAVHRRLVEGANLGCARCSQNLKWWAKHN